MVRAGKSWRVIATSPKARSRSTMQTFAPLPLRATARLTARVVLPTPPLGLKTVTRRPRDPSPVPPPAPVRACQTCRARTTAAPRPVRLRSSTTSRMPLRSASASTLVSTRRRIRITLILGRVTRRVSASAAAASRSTPGPITMAYSSGDSERSRLSSSRFPTTSESLPVTDVNRSALALLLSTMIGIRSPEEVRVGGARTRLHLGLRVEQPEAQFSVARRVNDSLRVLLVHSQREQRLRQLLGRRGATSVCLGGGDDRRRANRDHLDRRREQPGGVLAARRRGREDRHLGTRGDEASHTPGVGQVDGDGYVTVRDAERLLVARRPELAGDDLFVGVDRSQGDLVAETRGRVDGAAQQLGLRNRAERDLAGGLRLAEGLARIDL